jgi:hypothetical protein
MSTLQFWSLLGVFSAVMFAALGVATRYTVSTLRAEMHAIDARLSGRIDLADAKAEARSDAVEARVAALDAKLDTKIDTIDAKYDAKTDHIMEVCGIHFAAIDHRLGTVEDDLKIIKAHLLRPPAA